MKVVGTRSFDHHCKHEPQRMPVDDKYQGTYSVLSAEQRPAWDLYARRVLARNTNCTGSSPPQPELWEYQVQEALDIKIREVGRW